MKKILQNLPNGILAGLLICFLASCQDFTGPQGVPGTEGLNAVLSPDIGETLSAALAAKTGGGVDPWTVKISGLDLSDSYTARQIFHGVAAGIPEGGIDLDLSECTGAFFGYNAGVSPRDKARYTGLTLPGSLTSINDGKKGTTDRAFGAFTDFTSLKRISASGLLLVGNYAFFACTALETLDLPNVTAIGDHAFAANSNTSTSTQYANNTVLTRVDFPKVKTIGQYAFFRCLAIAELNLPEVISIKRSAFSAYSNAPNTVLETVDLPMAESLGISAFDNCPAISTINLPNAYELLGYTFGASDTYPNTVLTRVTLPEAATVVGAFRNCTALEEANLPVAGSIGGSTFLGCTSLTTVSAPELTSVGDNVFEGCTSLVSLNLPKARSLGASAFKDCTSLATLTIPELTNVTGANAFVNCTSLASLELPNVREFYSLMFSGCTGLTSLKLGPNVPTTTGVGAGDGIFLNTGSANPAITIKVPADSLATYASADWQQYNAGETGWIDTAANGHPVTWGTDHKQIIMTTY